MAHPNTTVIPVNVGGVIWAKGDVVYLSVIVICDVYVQRFSTVIDSAPKPELPQY